MTNRKWTTRFGVGLGQPKYRESIKDVEFFYGNGNGKGFCQQTEHPLHKSIQFSTISQKKENCNLHFSFNNNNIAFQLKPILKTAAYNQLRIRPKKHQPKSIQRLTKS